MLNWALALLLIAMLAAIVGFSGIAGSGVGLAKVLFLAFLVFFLVAVMIGVARRT
jgi:uncharacterized membrane protein YtjA (UPF0391 family)